VNRHLETRGIRIATGTIVDATIIHAPSSTKNEAGERDPAMHQTKKGKQWYFGLKGAHRQTQQNSPAFIVPLCRASLSQYADPSELSPRARIYRAG
jgi:uncharacterized ParB-like nuclease family protein